MHVAGQVARTADGQPVAAGDLTGQVAHVLHATARGLAAGGATFNDVVRLTFYVAGWQPGHMSAFLAGVQAVAEEVGLPTPMPPASLIGVSILFDPDVLVELEATAVLD
ncbi:RidA family protein [Jannaschia sp. R86511]|uniref:RidA family protein n=1 Tax=Jannaschia sp. R86511 TaxID=3093853 RepID=UPI0036D38C47